MISTLDVSTYLDIEWEEEETEKCEVSFKKQCETLNKTVSKNFMNFLDNFSSKNFTNFLDNFPNENCVYCLQ